MSFPASRAARRLAVAATISSALLAMPAAAQDATVAGAPRPITLQEAVRLAQRNSPLAVQARGQERNARAAVRSAYAGFIPSLTLTMGTTRNAGDRFDTVRDQVVSSDPTWQYNDGLGANLTLFDGGRRFFDVRTANAGIGSAEANATAQGFRVSLDVGQQYYAALAARESESAARAQLEQAEQQLRASIARLAAGAATKSDSLRSVIAVGNARLALLQAENDLRVANAALSRLVGSESLVTPTAADTGDVTPVAALDSSALVAMAERGPAVEQAQAELKAARASARAARTPYLPTITASYNRGRSASDSEFRLGGDPLVRSNTLRFGLSYPLFNQWQREEALTRAIVAEDVAEAQARDARLLAQQSLTQYLGVMQTAEQRIAIQRTSVAAAEEDLRVQQQRYQLGAATLLDVLTSQTQLNQARAALIQARYDYRVARAQIEALVGRSL